MTRLDQDATYGSKFGQGNKGDDMDVSAQSNSASHSQNPHLNRRNKALRDLDDRTEKQSIEDDGDQTIERNEANEGAQSCDKVQTTPGIKLSPRDPRAYLIRLADEKTIQVQGHTSKSKKSMLAKLPFETIDPAVATYTYLGVTESVVSEDIQKLSARVQVLDRIDSYVRNGGISSDISQENMTEDVMQQWERQIQRLLDGANIVRSDVSQKSTNVLIAE